MHFLDNSELKHITAQDVNESETKLAQLPNIVQKIPWLISVWLETGAFILQFLDYWHHDDNESKPKFNEFQPPLPPSQVEKTNQCPLCRTSMIQAATLLTTCGYVFCYKCIKSYIDETSTCPLSGISATDQQLIRIFSAHK